MWDQYLVIGAEFLATNSLDLQDSYFPDKFWTGSCLGLVRVVLDNNRLPGHSPGVTGGVSTCTISSWLVKGMYN